MDWKGLLARYWGAPLVILGAFLVFLSGQLFHLQSLPDQIGLGDRASEFLLRAGFGTLLLGVLSLFLFSFRSVPEEVCFSLQVSEGRNLGRLFRALNLEGAGVFVPPEDRHGEDMLYVQFEKGPLPLPDLRDEVVLNAGTSGASMGVQVLPPGKGLVDHMESSSGRLFKDQELRDASEALVVLCKGSGMYKAIDVWEKSGRIEMGISHSRYAGVCGRLWEEFPDLHLQGGCPVCSPPLCALTRIARTPLRVVSAERDGRNVRYVLEKER